MQKISHKELNARSLFADGRAMQERGNTLLTSQEEKERVKSFLLIRPRWLVSIVWNSSRNC
jgi:hypothetical protein